MLNISSQIYHYRNLNFYNKRYLNSLKFSRIRMLNNKAIKKHNKEKKILICLHSFDWGGAERFAFETIKFVQENNIDYEIFVEKRTDISDSFLSVLDFSMVTYADTYQNSAQQVLSLVHLKKINFISIHHSYSTYKALKYLPRNIFVLDSLHIIEFQSGGYPYLSAINTHYIDIHHVVSKGLKAFIIDELGVSTNKVKLGYLTNAEYENFNKKKFGYNREILTIGYIGRFEKQKRPELFIEIARKLNNINNLKVDFIMQGNGSLKNHTIKLANMYKISNIRFLESTSDIRNFHDKVDIVVNCSENEGLTLTGIECAQYRTLFISTDVGQQSEITCNFCLLPYKPRDFIQEAVSLIINLIYNKKFEDVLSQQDMLLNKLRIDTFENNILKRYILQ